MLTAQFQIDHVTVAGRNLRLMRDALASVGVNTENGGPHANRATEMALASFPDGSYLELIAPQPDADPEAVAAHYWSRFINTNAGPCAWAVQVPDTVGEVQRLSKRGIAVTAPARSGRTRIDGVRLDWEAAPVGPEPNGGFFPFLIQDITPRTNRVYPSGKPSTSVFRGIKRVVIAVEDLEDSVQRYQRAYDLVAPIMQEDVSFGARLAWFSDTPVILATPLSGADSANAPEQSSIATRVTQFGNLPCAFIMAGTASFSSAIPSFDSRWFGKRISWLDPAKLGWRLGVEALSPLS